MKTLGPCDILSFVAQSHTPRNRCVRFATTVASGHATLATKRTLLLTWAGLTPAGSHQLCLAHSFDHLVRAAEQREWDSEAESLGSLEVYDQLDFRRLHDRQVGRLLALENFPSVDPDQTVIVRFTASVADEAACPDERVILVNRGHGVAKCQYAKLFDARIEEIIGADDERGESQLVQGCKHCIQVAFGARI